MKYLASSLILLFLLSCNQGRKQNESKPLTNETACLFSQLAYCNKPGDQIMQFLPEWKIIWEAVALNGNHALVATDGKKYVIAIRGSVMEFGWDAFENWVRQDLNIVTQEDFDYCETSGARISTGAYRGWQNIIKMKDKEKDQDLLSFLLANTKGRDPIYITGHSLGGNLATVLAPYLSTKLKEAGRAGQPINVITFAAPAAGNAVFADAFDKKFPASVRVENAGDIVPKFPCPEAMATLSDLYAPSPSAENISVDYKFLSVSLSRALSLTITGIRLFELQKGFSAYKQTNGKGTLINLPVSGEHNTNDIMSWFAEAGYQHGIAQYAKAMGVPVIEDE